MGAAMSNIPSPCAPARTKSFPFAPLVSSREMFQVNPGIPAVEALSTASCYLDVALDLSREMAMEANNNNAWVPVYMIELAKAIIDSIEDTEEGGRP
jgi:hypothetical protein